MVDVKDKIKICNDVMFKSIFLRQRDALITMIYDITGINEKINKDEIITGYELEPYTVKGKVNRSDMLIGIGKDNYLNVEINYKHERNVTARNMIQLFRITSQVVESGMTDKELSLKMVGQLNLNTFRNLNNKIIQIGAYADLDTGRELDYGVIKIWNLDIEKCYKKLYNNTEKIKYATKMERWGAILYCSINDIELISQLLGDDLLTMEEKEKFINKSLKRGYKLDVVLKIYDLIVKFANYGFNKSHSVAYAYIAYQMAYLKFKYPEYFIIEMINGKDSDKIRDSISFLKSKGFRIIKPDINLSKNGFYVRNKDVMMPFIQVKGINEDVAKKIIEVRDIGFKDIFDFAYKTRDFINEDIFKKLVKAGLFDAFMINRHTLIENMESIMNYANLSDGTDIIKKPVLIEVNEYDEVDLRNDELEAYGMLISNHPSSKYKNVVKLCEIEKKLFKNVKCIVLVDKIRSIKTKKNEDMAFMLCSDETKSGDFTIFPNKYEIINNIHEGDLVEIMGSVSKRFDKVSIIVNNIKKVV